MENKLVKCGKLNISNTKPFTLIAGPCQLENEKHALDVATELKKITEKLGIGLIYKTSFNTKDSISLSKNPSFDNNISYKIMHCGSKLCFSREF